MTYTDPQAASVRHQLTARRHLPAGFDQTSFGHMTKV